MQHGKKVQDMHRLIEKGLMFGNLIRVDSPVLVERYNRALKHLIGRETALKVFHIDNSYKLACNRNAQVAFVEYHC